MNELSSYCIHTIKSNGSAQCILARVAFAPDQISSATRSRLQDLRFSNRNKVCLQFTCNQNEKSYQNKEFRIENRRERIPE